VRVYLPATLTMLRSWLDEGGAPPVTAYAVTPALREWYREGDLDELEYAAQTAAARASLGLLAEDPGAVRRRVVLAAEVTDADVATLDVPRGAVAIGAATPVSAWASALVDEEDADVVVSAAATALAAADHGDDDAGFTVDEAGALELSWYAVQELRELVAGG
jgi:hypothetical protein